VNHCSTWEVWGGGGGGAREHTHERLGWVVGPWFGGDGRVAGPGDK
jgi:hypothetical protein